MRNLNGPMLKKLVARKVVLSDEDGQSVLPETLLNARRLAEIKSEQEVEIEVPKAEPANNDLILVLKNTVEQIDKIVAIEKTLTEVVKEISKPKPKKNWNCSVSRASNGKIESIEIVEK